MTIKERNNINTIKTISLFSGAGGLDIGAIMAGAHIVFANDVMKEACMSYATNIGSHIINGDINSVMHQLDGIENVDMVIGGPPCQGFSVAGKMDVNDKRSQLIWSFVKVISMVRPKAFIMENVKALGLLEKWKPIRDKLLSELRDLGYSVNYMILNASDYDVPQARERIFIVGIIMITIVLSFFTLIFGELVPKRIAMKNSERVAFFSIGIIRAISIIAAPFVKLLTAVTNGISKLLGIDEHEEEIVTEEEIKMMIDQGKEKGTIEESEKELLNNVFEFNDIVASEIMTHRTDIFAVDKDISLDELLKEISKEEYRYSRIPVYDEVIDEIQGILYVKDILKNVNKKSFKIKDIMKDAYFVPQNKMIDELFKEMQKNKMQMAIVLDEYGGTAGLITMEDILEELVGDIYDEYDEVEEEYEKIDDDTYILSGSMPIYDVNKLIDAKIPEGDYDTLSGFLQEELGRIPDEEEYPTIETKEITYKIQEYEDRRIVKVKACKNHEQELEDSEDEEDE